MAVKLDIGIEDANSFIPRYSVYCAANQKLQVATVASNTHQPCDFAPLVPYIISIIVPLVHRVLCWFYSTFVQNAKQPSTKPL
jgi:hypothetical protein